MHATHDLPSTVGGPPTELDGDDAAWYDAVWYDGETAAARTAYLAHRQQDLAARSAVASAGAEAPYEPGSILAGWYAGDLTAVAAQLA